MYKYVYCHDSGEYDEYTSLKRSESKIFSTLRANTGTGTFLYAPTTQGNVILFAFSQSNGQFRVDGYKGEISEIGSNPAAYIGNVTVEKPYHEQLIGALPARLTLGLSDVDASRIADLAQCVIFGDTNREIVLLGRDITRRAAEYLKYLFLLFPSEYARKVGFCINKYLKGDIEDPNKFLASDEKPIVRIYALDSQKEFAGSYKINLDANERELESPNLGVKALRDLIKRGVTQSNFNEIFRATEKAFSNEGDVNTDVYIQCLIRSAYEAFHTPEYAEALVGYGFKNDEEKQLFVNGVNCCLQSGNNSQKKTAASRAIELLSDDMGAVAKELFEYIISQETVTASERNFIVQSAVAQLNDDSDRLDDEDLLNMYLHAVMPTWKQKYEFITDVIQRLFNMGNKLTANRVCETLSQRFNVENLAYAKDITATDLFSLKQSIDSNAKEAIFAALLKNDGNSKRMHTYTRAYLKKEPSFGDIINVRRKVQEIFGEDSGDFIFGDAECERWVRERIRRLELVDLYGIYNNLSTRLSDYAEMKAEFFFAMLNLDKLKTADASFWEVYKSFLTDVETEISSLENASGKDGGKDLSSMLQECKNYVLEKESDGNAQTNIKAFCDDFSQKLYEKLSDKEKNEIINAKKANVSEASAEDKPIDYQKVVAKFGASNSIGLHFNGTQSYGYNIALALLSGLIMCLLTFIPAICMAGLVGDMTLASFALYLSRYFYVAIIAPIAVVVLYGVLYLSLCKRKGGVTFGITALCAYIPCVMFGLGYVLSYILFT